MNSNNDDKDRSAGSWIRRKKIKIAAEPRKKTVDSSVQTILLAANILLDCTCVKR
jgi:hypothetical protein